MGNGRQNAFQPKLFTRTGIINEELFNANAPGKKILVIAKEPNAKNHEHIEDRSFVTEWNLDQAPGYIFAWRIAEWSYGIINDFPVYEEAARKRLLKTSSIYER